MIAIEKNGGKIHVVIANQVVWSYITMQCFCDQFCQNHPQIMFTLYRIDYHSATKTISDRPSVHIWHRRSGTIPVTTVSWNAPIRQVIHSVSDSFLERSTPNVNGLFSGSAPFLERNLIVTLLDSRVGLLLLDQNKYQSNMV